MIYLQLRGYRWGWQVLHAPGFPHEALESVVIGMSPIPGYGTKCIKVYLIQKIAGLIWFNMAQYTNKD